MSNPKEKFESKKLPMMPIRDVVIFPYMMTPFVVGRESSVRALEEALRAIARQAMARKVGARGLRMILEELMLELMYSLPSQKKVKEFEVTREMVEKRDTSLAVIEKAAS